MSFITGYCSETGHVKQVNQDSLCIKQARTLIGEVVLAVICDGMGGLSKGELASATVVKGFADWFVKELPELIKKESVDIIPMQWERLIQQLNRKLWEYGRANGVELGTTLTAMLCLEQGTYFVAQVGDTRAYELGTTITQLTEDQSYVAREVKRGNMTPDQARIDSRRNVLLQCIGASVQVVPEIKQGTIKSGSSYLLCSDGFRHELAEEEMLRAVNTGDISDSTAITHLLTDLVHLNEERGERDNISALLVHVKS